MNIVVGKLAGFCGGVINSVSKTDKLLEDGIKTYCLGELVHNKQVVDKLKDKLDVTSSFQAVEEYNRTKKDYLQRKEEYFNKEDKFPDKKLSTTKLKQAEDDKQLFQNLLKKASTSSN